MLLLEFRGSAHFAYSVKISGAQQKGQGVVKNQKQKQINRFS